MDIINVTLVPVIESAIKESVANFEAQKEENSLSDMYLRFDADSASLIIYDDMENCLLKANLEKEQEEIISDFEKQLTISVKQALHNLENAGFFNKEFIFKPFSVSMVDEDLIVSKELLFIDDDTLQLDNDLFSNLDKELDLFLKNLMKS